MGPVDTAALARTLRRHVDAGVHDDPGARALYAADASNYRVVPDLVVVPRTVDDLATVLQIVRAAAAPVAMRGAGTSVAGNALGGVVVDTSRHLTEILDIDAASGYAVVEPGVVLADLQRAAARVGLTFGADPSSGSRATLGGMIGNNACGAHSLAWGTTSDNLVALEVVTGSGDRITARTPSALPTAPDAPDAAYRRLDSDLAALAARHEQLIRRRFGRFSRQMSGYPLQHLLGPAGPDVARLLCGTEGTLAVTLRATLALTPLPPARVLLVVGYLDAVSAADSVPLAREHGPLTMESLNATMLDRIPAPARRAAEEAGLPPGRMWLLLEMAGDDPDAARRAAADLASAVRDGIPGTSSAILTDIRAQAVLWRCRTDSTGLATRRADGAEAWPGWEDAAVPPERLGAYLRGLDELLGRYGYTGASFGHFGEGCLHLRIDFDLLTESGVHRYRSFLDEATDLVVSLGGSISGEHGDGRARSDLLARMYGGDTVRVFREVKDVFDPDRLLNPHVVVDPLPVDLGLRQRGVAGRREVATVFGYPQDAGSFAAAQRRCVGVGSCRSTTGGVMCPSYQVLCEEEHSTRGRAHLLWEMLEGDLITDGWRSAQVRDALDLCLSCKGCLADCPVDVDMATYKSEFLHHHHRRRPWTRPRSHWSLGWLPVWLRAAARAPRLVTAATRSPAAPWLARAAGIAPERGLPRVPSRVFSPRPAPAAVAPRGPVLLWPDTFTRHLAPEVGHAAVAVLRDAGFEVRMPGGPVCCGLTWISTGQPRVAARVLRRSLDVVGPAVDAGIPVVGVEPSCLATLHHDGPQLLPTDPRMARLSGATHTLAGLLSRYAPEWDPPQVGGSALVQAHCHQYAVLGVDTDEALLRRAGVAVERPEAGCCGMAGTFGMEPGYVALSRAIAERALLPAIRAARPDTVVVADGYSCRTQVGYETPRQAIHLAQLLAAALPDRG